MSNIDIYLIIAAYGTSILSAVIGMGGGIILLAFMTAFLPIAAVVPLHGVVQWWSNTSRAFLIYKHLNWKIIGRFCLGALPGAYLGSQLDLNISEKNFQIILGVFILLATWLPKFKAKKDFNFKFSVLGFFIAPWSLFVGATGSLLAPFFLREGLGKHAMVATKAGCQFIVHTLKIIIFASFGFAFHEYLNLLIAMVIAVIAGSYTGRLLLDRLPEKYFYWIFKPVITILALRLLYKAFI